MATIKITELTSIGANLTSSTVIPVVNMSGTPTTEKTLLGNIANVVLAGAGGNYTAAAVSILAQSVTNAAQPNITSVGTLTNLAISGNLSTTGLASITTLSVGATANLGAVGNITITGGTVGQVLSTDGNGVLSWASDTTTYGNSNVAAYLPTYTGNIGGDVVTANLFSGNGQALTNIAGANVSGFVPNANVANTAFAVAASNVSGLGNIATLNLDGNASNLLTGNGTYVAIPVVPTVGNIATIDLDGNVSNLLTGNGTYVAIPVVPTVGNIATINLDGNSSNVLFGNGVFSPIPVVNNVANANYANFAGTVITNAQSNITSVGTLTGLDVNGNISANVINPNVINEVNYIDFDTAAGISVGQGQMAWNSSDGTVDIGIGYSNVVLQVGQETHYVVRNDTGTTILNGTSVYCSGVTVGSGRMEAEPFVANGSINLVQYLGLATQDISSGVNGVVTYFGYVRNLDTRGTANTAISVGDETWAVGDKLYAHPTVAGKLTNVEPIAPNDKICVCVIITRNQTSGTLFVRPTTNLRTINLSDVTSNLATTGDVLVYNSSNVYTPSNTVPLANLATFATTANSVAGANVSGTVANANFASYSNVSNSANSVAVGNVVGIGNIATINLDGNSSNILRGDGTFGADANSSYGDSNVVSLLTAFGSNTIVTTGIITADGANLSNVPYANLTGAPSLGNISNINLDGNVSNLLTGNGTYVAIPVVPTVGNIATINLDGNSQTWLAGNGVFANIAIPTVGNIATINLDGNVSNLLTGNGTYVAIPVVPTVGNIATINLDGNSSNVLRGDGTFAADANSSYGDSNVASLLGAFGSNTITTTGNITGGNIIGNGSTLSNVAVQTIGSWTLASGVNTVSISVPLNGTYAIWINGNIPNGIATYTATAVVTNTNVPVLGSQYAWYYETGNALVFTSIPNQFVGTEGSISNASPYGGNTANVFTFGITNNSGSSQVVNYGFTKL